jgi:hypothetical protein
MMLDQNNMKSIKIILADRKLFVFDRLLNNNTKYAATRLTEA